MKVKPIFWVEGEVAILDQRLLPEKVVYIRCKRYQQVAQTIKNMAIRGAPAIGICLLYTSPSPRDRQKSRMPSSA